MLPLPSLASSLLLRLLCCTLRCWTLLSLNAVLLATHASLCMSVKGCCSCTGKPGT